MASQKNIEFSWQNRGRRGLEIYLVTAVSGGNYLHRPIFVITKRSGFYAVHSAGTGREKTGMSAAQSFRCQCDLEIAPGIHHHVRKAFDMIT